MNHSTPGLPVHHQLLESNPWSQIQWTKSMSIESVMPSNYLILCCPLLLLPSIFPRIRVFSNESALRIRWPKYWSFSFNISPSNEHPGLISFRIGYGSIGQGVGKRAQNFHAFPGATVWDSVHVHQPGSSLNPLW